MLLYSTVKCDKTIGIYTCLNKKYSDYESLCQIGLSLLSYLIAKYYESIFEKIAKDIEFIANDLYYNTSKLNDNKYQNESRNLISLADECLYEMLTDIYYSNFDYDEYIFYFF